MNASADRPHGPPGAGTLLLAGIVGAALTEAIAGSALALARADIAGSTQATPDELAWLETAYTALKLIGFMLAPWMIGRGRIDRLLVAATLAMGAASLGCALSERLDLLVALRAVQGLAGGVLLVAGQTLVFLAFPRHRQPALQALFAVGAVVAPATLTPALAGWTLDRLSWPWIFLAIVPLALGAAGLLLADRPLRLAAATATTRRPFDWLGAALLAAALGCLSFVLGQGSRWDWFEEPCIVALTAAGLAALLAFLARQLLAGPRALLDFRLFRSEDFAFASLVSLVAGAALFGTAFLIPAFALTRLAFTPAAAGALLLPSSACFVAALVLSAYLMQARRVPPIATVPFGILLIMTSMWLLSGSSGDSGAADMMGALLLRGLGLGFLFLSITLVAFGQLPERQLAAGIGLFNTGRQLGGLLGVAGLQTLIEHEAAANLAALGAHVTAGLPVVGERLATTTALFAAQGLDTAAAATASAGLLGRAVGAQAAVIAFDTAFMAVALFFVVAAPLLLAFKAALARARRG